MTDETELTPEAQGQIKKIAQQTKRGFDLKERLQNRGLRQATITLFLDEELGPQIGWAYDSKDLMGNIVKRERQGIIGKIDEIEAAKALAVKDHDDGADLDAVTKKFDDELLKLSEERDKLVEKLTATGLTVKIKAVPPIIQKDTRRKAKVHLGIEGKNIPEDMLDEFYSVQQAYLMTVMIQTITDNESGTVNESISYEDAVDLIDLLPPGQWDRLNNKMTEVQFTDAISRSIEGQEDFS